MRRRTKRKEEEEIIRGKEKRSRRNHKRQKRRRKMEENACKQRKKRWICKRRRSRGKGSENIPTIHPVVDESDVAQSSVPGEEIIDLLIRRIGIQVEHAQTFIFRRRLVMKMTGTTSKIEKRKRGGNESCAAETR